MPKRWQPFKLYEAFPTREAAMVWKRALKTNSPCWQGYPRVRVVDKREGPLRWLVEVSCPETELLSS